VLSAPDTGDTVALMTETNGAHFHGLDAREKAIQICLARIRSANEKRRWSQAYSMDRMSVENAGEHAKTLLTGC